MSRRKTGTARTGVPGTRRVPPNPVRLRERGPVTVREIEAAIANRRHPVAKARARAALTEDQALRLAVTETRAVRRQTRKH